MTVLTKVQLVEDNNRLRGRNQKLEEELKELREKFNKLENRYNQVSYENNKMKENIGNLISPVVANLIKANLSIRTSDDDGWTEASLSYDGEGFSSDSFRSADYYNNL